MIKKDEITNIELFNKQGGSWSTTYQGIYNNHEVIIKVQDLGSLQKTDLDDDRFLQEQKVLELDLPGIVDYYGWGNDWEGERFIVIEKLQAQSNLNKDNFMIVMKTVLLTSRQLFLKGFNWTWNIHHVMYNNKGCPKLIDFNDGDAYKVYPSFFNREKWHDIDEFLVRMHSHHNQQTDIGEIRKSLYSYLLEEEFKSLENCHDPVYFPEYAHFERTETERDDPTYGQLVPPTRNCYDRGRPISESLSGITGTSLNIGCNTGWFTFLLNELGFNATGIDIDDLPGNHRPDSWKNGTGGKIEFAKLVSEYKQVDNIKFDFANVNLDYVKNMKEYDVVMALSILHLYLEWPKITLGIDKITREYWMELFITLASKANKVFIFEVPDRIMSTLGFTHPQSFYEFIQETCKFKSIINKGITDNGRPLIVCYK